MSKNEDAITSVYSALANPIRRQIVDILRRRGKAGFKDLHENLKISVGGLYHHLESLEGLVTQGPDKKYVLTEKGRSAIETLSVSEEKIAIRAPRPSSAETRFAFFSKEVLFGRTLFHYLNEEALRSLPLAVMLVVLGGWISSQTNLEPILLFYLIPSSVLGRPWLILLFPLGWLATFAITDVLTIAIFNRKGGELSLLNGTAFAMSPLLVVPGIYYIAQLLNISVRTENLLIVLLPILLQVWVVCLLSSAVSVSKGLRVERTALVSLGVTYLNILVLVAALELGLF